MSLDSLFNHCFHHKYTDINSRTHSLLWNPDSVPDERWRGNMTTKGYDNWMLNHLNYHYQNNIVNDHTHPGIQQDQGEVGPFLPLLRSKP